MKAKGFSLIELVIVIVVIGILAGGALVAYRDMSTTSYEQTAKSIAASLTTAAGRNYRYGKIGSSRAVAVDNCQDASGLMPSGAIPSGYTITSSAISPGARATCTLTAPDTTTTATFVAVGVSTS